MSNSSLSFFFLPCFVIFNLNYSLSLDFSIKKKPAPPSYGNIWIGLCYCTFLESSDMKQFEIQLWQIFLEYSPSKYTYFWTRSTIVVTLITRFQNIWIETSVNILEDSQIYYVLEKNLTTTFFNFFNKKNFLHRIGICCFFTKHAALRRKIKDWLTQNQNNVSEWGDMFICGASTIKIKLSVLV